MEELEEKPSWRLWGLPRPGPQSVRLHPVEMPPSRKAQKGIGAGETHAAKQLPDTALTLCVSSLALDRLACARGWGCGDVHVGPCAGEGTMAIQHLSPENLQPQCLWGGLSDQGVGELAAFMGADGTTCLMGLGSKAGSGGPSGVRMPIPELISLHWQRGR